MSLTQFARRRSRQLAAGLVAGALVAAAVSTPADAAAPAGSRGTVMLETGDAPTYLPSNAITPAGWWGHEGGAGNGTGTGATYLSMDASDGNGNVTAESAAALATAMGTDDLSKLRFVVVPYSADGSNEDPTMTAGQNVGEVFTNGWIMGESLGSGLIGNANPNDSVTTVSTYAELTAWIAAGRPVQSYDNSLVLSDVEGGSTAHPQGKSILNRWPGGTKLSLVAYVSDGMDPDPTLDGQVPLVKMGPDGKAETAWMPFTTVADPTDATRSSAGYSLDGPYAPTLTLAGSASGTTGTLTATIKNKGNTLATDATGTLEFAQVVGGVPGTPTSVPVTNGAATLNITGFTPGTSRTYEVHYAPDTPAQAKYLDSDAFTKTITNPQLATSVALSAVGGATDTFTATVAPGLAGKVTFKDGATAFATLSVSPSVRTVKAARKLTVGRHVVSATFTPTSTSYETSVASRTLWQGTVTGVLKPVRPVHGTRPKLTVKVTAPGTAVSGRVTVVFDPPKGATKRFVLTLRAGTATLVLPKVVKGLTRLTLMYGGNATVLASNKAISFRAT